MAIPRRTILAAHPPDAAEYRGHGRGGACYEASRPSRHSECFRSRHNMIRLGIIGCGTMTGIFLQGLRALGERLRIAALADVDPERLKRAGEHAPGARLEGGYRRILNDVDAVLIALPHDLHHEVGLACLAA